MAAWEFCLQNGGVSEGFTHKMAAWEICLQDGGNAAFLRVLPQDGGMGDFPTNWRRFWESYPQDGGVAVLPTRWQRL